MKKKYFLLVFILFSITSYSQSDEGFVYVTSDPENFNYYISIEKVGLLTVDVWIKAIEPTKTVKNKKGKYVKTGGTNTLRFVSLYCSNREFDIKQKIAYSLNGKVLASDDFPEYGKKVIPGSVMANICDYICSQEVIVEE